MSAIPDPLTELEDRIAANCMRRWVECPIYEQAELDRAYAQLLIAQLALEASNEN